MLADVCKASLLLLLADAEGQLASAHTSSGQSICGARFGLFIILIIIFNIMQRLCISRAYCERDS